MIYLSEIRKELPSNCLYNKVLPGCGGTSMAIESEKSYVIAVPYCALVSNKAKSYPNARCPYHVLAVMGEMTVWEIQKGLSGSDVLKIITTYDCLPKVVDALGGRVSEVNLLVDECHLLFMHYLFRKQAVKRVLNLYNMFKTFCFMTATPLESEFILDELKDLEIVTQEWPEDVMPESRTRLVKCFDVKAAAQSMIGRFLKGEEPGNLYLFVNSVSIINHLVETAKLTPENCRVVYSKHNETEISYESEGARIVIPNSTVEDSPKKINFLTSTTFEGCDIYDSEGKTVILTEPSSTCTLVDVSTTVMQIRGRIRDSKYNSEITHLYRVGDAFDVSYEEYYNYIQAQSDLWEETVRYYDSIPTRLRDNITLKQNRYAIEKDGMAVFDRNLLKIDLYSHKLQYDYASTTTLMEEYVAQDTTVEVSIDKTIQKTENEGEGAARRKTFKDIVKEIREAAPEKRDALLKEAKRSYSFIEEAIEKLGFQRIESLKYVQYRIKDELLKISDSSSERKIFDKLNYKVNKFYDNKTIKQDLEAVYTSLGYDHRTAKATDIATYYDVKDKTKIVQGKKLYGYVIMAPRY